MAFYVCYMVLVSILIASFGLVVESGISTIDKMVDFMYASVPVLITLLVSSGNVVSGGALQPLLIMAVQISNNYENYAHTPYSFVYSCIYSG